MIPEELKKRKQWVCWKLVGADKRKVPFQPSWQPASSTDKATWSSYEDCLAQSDKIGFVFTPDDPYIGVDLDGCRNAKTGVIESWAWDVLENFATYSEISPSSTGVKLWGIFDGVWKHKNKVDFEGNHCGVEVYQTGRFFCVTGKVIAGFETIENITGGMEWFAEKFKMQKDEGPQAIYVRKSSSSSVVERASAYVSKIPPSIAGQGGHNVAFHVACILVNGFMLDNSDARSVFMEFNSRCQPPWSDAEITHKLKSAANSKGERGQLLNANSNDWGKIDLTKTWSIPKQSEPKTEVRIKTLEQSAKDVAANNKAGRKSLITLGIPELDEAIEGGADVGEMVIIGARPSHGKSAIALQMVHHMSKSFPVGIISQEMSALALGKRTLQFITEIPQDDWAIRSDDIDADLNDHFAERKPAFIVEGVTDINQLCDTSMQMMERDGIKALFVDYAQIITGKGTTQYERVTDVSKRLRNMATNTGLLIVTLAQLGREVEKRPDFFPTSKDLKDSGQLEQDADVIIFGAWPYKVAPQKFERNHYQFFIDKNRNRNRVKHGFDLFFEPHRQRYLEKSVAAINAAAMKNEFNFPKDF